MSWSLNGGYSCKLVSQPKELQTECSICLQLLRAPEMVSCCGNKFCQSCISHILNKNNRCPLCGQTNITTMPDRQLERTLNSLEIYCVHAEEGCKWTGELRELQRHLNQSYSKTDWLKGCEYENVKCKHCHRKFSRMEVTHHMIDCPEARIPCEFKVYGCTKVVMRKNMTKHIGENTEHHTSLMENWAKSLGLSSRLHHAAKQFSREIRGRGEEYVSRAELYNLVTELKFFACGHAEYTLQKTNSLLWKAGGVFLVIMLVILLAFGITAYYIRDLRQENRNLKEQLETLSTKLGTFSDKKFKAHKHSHEQFRAQLDAIVLEHRAEIQKLQDTIDELSERLSNSDGTCSDTLHERITRTDIMNYFAQD